MGGQVWHVQRLGGSDERAGSTYAEALVDSNQREGREWNGRGNELDVG